MNRQLATYRPMSEEERELALALGKCSFPGPCFSARFAAIMKARAGKDGTGTITDRQAARLRVQCYIYRRQMPAHLVPSSPPAGYQTPKQRSELARLEEYRRRIAQGKGLPNITAEEAREGLKSTFLNLE